jgi:hypothetical protein
MLLLIVALCIAAVAAWELFWLGYFAVCVLRLVKGESKEPVMVTN